MPRRSKMPSNRRLLEARMQELPWYQRLPIWVYRSIAAGLVIMLGLVAMASYGWGNISRLHLPIPPLVSLLAVALPVGNFLGISHALFATKGDPKRLKTFRTNFYVTLLLILDTILATIAASHLPPGMLNCRLGESWSKMYSAKDELHIRNIQDALNCCGFRTTKDRSFPFPSGKLTPICVDTYKRDPSRSCFLPWREHEQTSATLYLLVGLVLGLAKFALMVYLNRQGLQEKENNINGEEIGQRVDEIESNDEIPENGIRWRLEQADETTGLLSSDPEENRAGSSSNHR